MNIRLFVLGPGHYDVQKTDRGPSYSFGVKLPTAIQRSKFTSDNEISPCNRIFYESSFNSNFKLSDKEYSTKHFVL